MARRLPSMNALRSFEAAARHQSFALAAKELCVSPAAVGFQVKRIEEDLGCALFIRKHRAVALTPKGVALVAQLTKGFDLIEAAWATLEQDAPVKTLKVSAPVTAVKRWLFDDMQRHAKAIGTIRIAWDVSQLLRPFDGNGPDAAIRYRLSPEEGLFSEPIVRPWFTPHMRPDIARKIKTAACLQDHGLINVDYTQDNTPHLTAWAPWFKAQGLTPPTRYEMVCADTATAVDMAIETGHVAMGGYFATRDHLASGTLVAPFSLAVCPKSQFWFVCEKGRENEPDMLWLRTAIKSCAESLNMDRANLTLTGFDGTPK